MKLMNAIIVFVISNYLKLFAFIAPLCSLWRYYQQTKQIHLIFLELILVIVISLAVFSSLSLSRMDCTRIANYFLLPALIGLAYFNAAFFKRASDQSVQNSTEKPTRDEEISSVSTGLMPSKTLAPFVDSLELAIANGLTGLICVQMLANFFGTKQAGRLS